MRVYTTDFETGRAGETFCICICDAKRRADGIAVPRESMCKTGLDFEKRFNETEGAACVFAYSAHMYRGRVVAYGFNGMYKSDDEARRSIRTSKGLDFISVYECNFSR